MSPADGQIPKRSSPVRLSSACIATPVTDRLACVKHAASVQSEPGSNSSLDVLRLHQERSPKSSTGFLWILAVSLRLQTIDASPHTNYLFRFLKSDPQNQLGEPRIMRHSACLSTAPRTNLSSRRQPALAVCRAGSVRKGAQYSEAKARVNICPVPPWRQRD